MIKIRKINLSYDGKTKILSNFSINFEMGKISMILGPNGSGKSTLLKAMVGYLPLLSGDISIKGKSIKKQSRLDLAKQISLIPQHFSQNFDFTVEELVLMGRFPYIGYWESYSKKDKEIVEKILNELDLYRMKDKFYNRLSGGEKQRVSIARALAQDTDIILMDEAFVNLDINHQLELMNFIKTINEKQGKTIIFVSHNINLAAEYGDRIFFIKKGELFLEGKPQEVINSENLGKLFETDVNVIKNPLSGKPNFVYTR